MSGSVAILGGGIVGVSCALELLRRDADVTLIDRRPPGQETSYGNAGVIARSSLVPLNNPTLWRGLPRLLTNRTISFRYNISFVMRNLGWVLGFLGHARRGPFEETSAALEALIRCSEAEHHRLATESGSVQRLRKDGWVFLYRTQRGYDGSALSRSIFERYGIDCETLDQGALSELEPGLKPIFRKALWIKEATSVDNPGGLVEDYARLFADRGGRIEQREIREARQGENGWALIDAEGRKTTSDRIVVALGPWAKAFMAKMGVRIPMGFERGYHMHFAQRGNASLGRPVYDTSGGYVLSPMARGLRLTTGVELNGCDAPKNPAQLRQALVSAQEAFPLGEALDDEPWLGRRPTLPDSRPIIGEAPGRTGLWLAFGHQHIGFSTGPGTARILADQMNGQRPPIDSRPFRPERFL